MTDLENKVLQAATGEKRLNPDEQRLYFGTLPNALSYQFLLMTAV